MKNSNLYDRIDYILKRLEWSGIYSYCTGWPCCPLCRGIAPGHGLDKDGNPPINIGHSKECPYYNLSEEKDENRNK